LIRPILVYSIGVWGVTKWPEVESLQAEMGRMILGVSKYTATAAVRGELGLWSMEASIKLEILSWWARIIKMDKNRLCFKVYKFRRDQVNDRPSWCRFVRDLLVDLNLGAHWDSEAIPSLKTWRLWVKKRLAIKEETEWRNRLLKFPKLRVYRLLKSNLSFESYLLELPLSIRRNFSQFRCGTSDLRIETGRWAKEVVNDRLCCLCGGEEVEDELHVLLDCWVYNHLRSEMFDTIRNRTGDFYQLSLNRNNKQWMLQTLLGENILDKDHRKLVQAVVASFLRKAMKRRKLLTDGTD